MLPNGLSGEPDVRLCLQCPPRLWSLHHAAGVCCWQVPHPFTHSGVCQASAEQLAAAKGLPEMVNASFLPAFEPSAMAPQCII